MAVTVVESLEFEIKRALEESELLKIDGVLVWPDGQGKILLLKKNPNHAPQSWLDRFLHPAGVAGKTSHISVGVLLLGKSDSWWICAYGADHLVTLSNMAMRLKSVFGEEVKIQITTGEVGWINVD